MPATAHKKDRRGRDLARIHILKAALRLDRETYEAVLWTHGRVESSALLDEHGRREVITQLEAVLRSTAPQHAALKRFSTKPRNLDVKGRRELQKIEALLTDAGRDWPYAHGIARRMYKRDRVEFCHAGQLAGIIAALEKEALKRLSAELEGLLGKGWADAAGRYAALLFDFDAQHRDIARYTQPLSAVLRWWRGELPAVCAWPMNPDPVGHCSGCRHRQAGLP